MLALAHNTCTKSLKFARDLQSTVQLRAELSAAARPGPRAREALNVLCSASERRAKACRWPRQMCSWSARAASAASSSRRSCSRASAKSPWCARALGCPCSCHVLPTSQHVSKARGCCPRHIVVVCSSASLCYMKGIATRALKHRCAASFAACSHSSITK